MRMMTHAPTYVDCSTRPVLQLLGPEALDLLQRISTNDVRSLQVGNAAGTLLTTDKGRIRDVLSIVRPAEAELLLFGTLSDRRELAAWIERFVIMEDLKVTDLTDEFVRYQLLWPASSLFGGGSFQSLELGPGTVGAAWIMPDYASGGRALHLIAGRHLRSSAQQFLERQGFRRGDDASLRDFCVYYGVPVPGVELSVEVNPHEAGLIGLVSFTKGCYIGQEVIARLDTYQKVHRRLVSFELSGKPARLPARLASGSIETGVLTSAVYVDELGSWIGTGFVKPSFVERPAPASYDSEAGQGVARLRQAPQH